MESLPWNRSSMAESDCAAAVKGPFDGMGLYYEAVVYCEEGSHFIVLRWRWAFISSTLACFRLLLAADSCHKVFRSQSSNKKWNGFSVSGIDSSAAKVGEKLLRGVMSQLQWGSCALLSPGQTSHSCLQEGTCRGECQWPGGTVVQRQGKVDCLRTGKKI